MGTRVHNKAQMGGLPVGFPLDSFLDLLPQSVGLSQKSWLSPGSRVHSHRDPPFPLLPFRFCSSTQEVLPSLAPKPGPILCLNAGTLVSRETPPSQTCSLGTVLDILGVLKKDLPHLPHPPTAVMFPPHLHPPLLHCRHPENQAW